MLSPTDSKLRLLESDLVCRQDSCAAWVSVLLRVNSDKLSSIGQYADVLITPIDAKTHSYTFNSSAGIWAEAEIRLVGLRWPALHVAA